MYIHAREGVAVLAVHGCSANGSLPHLFNWFVGKLKITPVSDHE